MEDHYEVLGVAHDASTGDIKRSYRQKLLELHPDKRVRGDSEDFVKLHEAWKTLSDDEKRREYDAFREQQKTASNHPINEQVNLSEMDTSVDGGFTWTCRCGGTYYLHETPGSDTLVGCDMCSFFILVVC
ncbi:unnamed protein product [Ixodes hexagonus]